MPNTFVVDIFFFTHYQYSTHLPKIRRSFWTDSGASSFLTLFFCNEILSSICVLPFRVRTLEVNCIYITRDRNVSLGEEKREGKISLLITEFIDVHFTFLLSFRLVSCRAFPSYCRAMNKRDLNWIYWNEILPAL